VDYYPIFLNLKGRHCTVVGGGDVATRKIATLIEAGAVVTVVSPKISTEISDWVEAASVNHCHIRDYETSDLNNQFLVIAATNAAAVNQHVYRDAEQARILINVVDSPEHCSFILPSIVDRSPLMIAISSGGAAPVLARKLRQKLETFVPFGYRDLALFAGQLRSVVKSKLDSLGQRRKFWEKFFEGPIANMIMSGRGAEARVAFDTELEAVAGRQSPESRANSQDNDGTSSQVGEVYLVGAGPGDPELLTLKALRLMQQADVVLYDNLVSSDILDLIRRDAKRISVAKAKGRHSVPQQDINSELVRFASEGKRVCRLKGGDPFIFGRGGEELETLVEAGIPFQVVPGISAANGCAAYAGIPLTHRDFADSVTFVTGHRKDHGYFDLPLDALSTNRQTIVFYMGLTSAGLIREKLIDSGMSASTPVAVVEQGTRRDQRVLLASLEELPEQIANSDMKSPALIIVGGVVTLAESFHWFGESLMNTLPEKKVSLPMPMAAAAINGVGVKFTNNPQLATNVARIRQH
jgi:uroporphyrin-III C-methyltransferase/precorrin-2 dehydrogenase/sirohydrochlorin ferrochelatase